LRPYISPDFAFADFYDFRAAYFQDGTNGPRADSPRKHYFDNLVYSGKRALIGLFLIIDKLPPALGAAIILLAIVFFSVSRYAGTVAMRAIDS
jgi:hypothetical protein